MPDSMPSPGSLPQDSESFHELTPEFQVLAIREAFGRAWTSTAMPDIRLFLKGLHQSLASDVIRALVHDDRRFRREHDLPCSVNSYLAALPDYEPVLRETLADSQTAEESDGGHRADTVTEVVSVAFESTAPQPDKAADFIWIKHFRLQKVLGRGAFGEVQQGVDEHSGRLVAVKLAHPQRVSDEESAQRFLAEALVLAELQHPNIVEVLDAGRTPDGQCYVVSQLIDGGDLAQRMKNAPYAVAESVELIAKLAEALHYAHQRLIVHRDIKPANILLDSHGEPYLADFGLALTDDDYGAGQLGQRFGSPAYMSPEQARGESHLVDGRTDIYALGVILYELLTGRRPFVVKALEDPNLSSTERHQAILELLRRIAEVEVRPPRMLNDSIPRELERICLKALSKRAADRYLIAGDLAEDLLAYLSGPTDASPQQQPARIIPKGLRSFSAEDADFFLELLPGPHDRTGLPESLRFWKTRIEQRDADETFRVGLIYGPSGCGKSSLMKAGLLPRLSNKVVAIYVEATANETEVRLVNAIQKQCPNLQEQSSLHELLLAVRRGQGLAGGRKLLLVIDQFEQWLHAQHDLHGNELVQALRQCDGQHLQCLVMVREDFWMAVTRFLDELEVPQVQGHNAAAVDRLPPAQAKKTLTAFGIAYGMIADDDGLSGPQREFIEQAVELLTADGKVICVRLALFAEMVKGKPWLPETLKDSGGAQGIGVTFLNETFSQSSAPPKHRYHQQAARAILKALLPDAGTDIKGHWKSRTELLEASGYANQVRDFDDLIRILDSEIRLITPTDPEGHQLQDDVNSAAVDSSEQYYQLTHDYLVPSLRDWLTRKQQETRRGRAELRLEDRTREWTRQPIDRRLPSWWEFLNIRCFTRKHNWTEEQRRMMRMAGRVHGSHWGAGFVLILAVAISLQQWVSAANHRNMVDRIQTAISAMGTSRGVLVPRDIEKLEEEEFDQDIVLDELRTAYAGASDAEKLGLAYAMAHFGEVDAEFLVSQMKEQPASESRNLTTALMAATESVTDVLAAQVAHADAEEDWAYKLRLATVALRLGDPSIAAEMLRAFPVGMAPLSERPELIVEMASELPAWDPIQRTTFIREFASWCDAPEETVAAMSASNDQELRSGMCLALAQIKNPVQATTDAWQEILSRWATNSPDSGTHSAARLALTRWGLKVPKTEATFAPASDRDWWHTPVGVRLVRIRPGRLTNEDNEPVVVKTEFWLSDVEVTVEQFEQFISDPDYPSGKKPEDWEGAYEFSGLSSTDQKSHPVQRVSWYDAVLFCNWLSEQHGLEPCYWIQVDPKDENEYVVSIRDAGAGYRLPTEAEWEYACRAMTTTAYAFGEDSSQIVDYGCLVNNSGDQTSCVGSYLPNGWGLFDMHGNVWERCWDHELESSDRASRGGSWLCSSGNCRSSVRFSVRRGAPSVDIGFRLAMTQRGGDPAGDGSGPSPVLTSRSGKLP